MGYYGVGTLKNKKRESTLNEYEKRDKLFTKKQDVG